jgi:hypothetical protein
MRPEVKSTQRIRAAPWRLPASTKTPEFNSAATPHAISDDLTVMNVCADNDVPKSIPGLATIV